MMGGGAKVILGCCFVGISEKCQKKLAVSLLLVVDLSATPDQLAVSTACEYCTRRRIRLPAAILLLTAATEFDKTLLAHFQIMHTLLNIYFFLNKMKSF